MVRMRDLVEHTHSGRISRSEISDPTIIVSSLNAESKALYGVIYPPQLARVVEGAIGPRSAVTIRRRSGATR